jgi:hypothetical protein
MHVHPLALLVDRVRPAGPKGSAPYDGSTAPTSPPAWRSRPSFVRLPTHRGGESRLAGALANPLHLDTTQTEWRSPVRQTFHPYSGTLAFNLAPAPGFESTRRVPPGSSSLSPIGLERSPTYLSEPTTAAAVPGGPKRSRDPHCEREFALHTRDAGGWPMGLEPRPPEPQSADSCFWALL